MPNLFTVRMLDIKSVYDSNSEALFLFSSSAIGTIFLERIVLIVIKIVKTIRLIMAIKTDSLAVKYKNSVMFEMLLAKVQKISNIIGAKPSETLFMSERM